MESNTGLNAIVLKVEAIESDPKINPSQCEISIFLNKSFQNKVTIGKSTTINLTSSNSILQLIAQSQLNNLGSVSFNLNEIIELERGHGKRHWITLFDDEEDNIYDGDYEEDDVDFPRVLLSYKIIKNQLPFLLGSSERGGMTFGVKGDNMKEAKKEIPLMPKPQPKCNQEDIRESDEFSNSDNRKNDLQQSARKYKK